MQRIILLALSLLSLNLSGQTTAVEAKALLQAASQKIESYQSVKLRFTFKFVNTRVDPPIEQNQKGSLWLKGEDYRLKLPGMEQLRLGSKLYNILHEDEEVQITEYEEGEDQGLTPGRMLKLYQKGYSYKLGGSENVDGKTIQYVILKDNASEEIDKVMIGIEKQSKQLYSMKQWGTNGTETTFEVIEFEANPKLLEATFRFRKEDFGGYYISE